MLRIRVPSLALLTVTTRAYIKINGVYVKATPWIKIVGVWKKGVFWIKVAGVWKKS